jgi:hypothetical protein
VGVQLRTLVELKVAEWYSMFVDREHANLEIS